jgi:hypothetical protein
VLFIDHKTLAALPETVYNALHEQKPFNPETPNEIDDFTQPAH